MRKGQIVVITEYQNGSAEGSIVKIINSGENKAYYDSYYRVKFFTDYYRLATEKERRYRLRALKDNPNKVPNIKNMKK